MKKIILITGASSGIGKETAKKLLCEGNIVYGGARNIDNMKDVKNLIPIKMDITKYDTISNTINKIIKEQGKIDVLINNAVFGLARLTQLVLPIMRKQKSGTIVNISSMGGRMYTPMGAWYHATKHALEGWSDCLRLETKQFGINVIIIEPGLIRTNFGNVLIQKMAKKSNQGPYKKLVNSVVNAAKSFDNKGWASPPLIIAKTISKAINSKKPKTRYAAGKMAKSSWFIRKWFGDKIFDKFVMLQLKMNK
jgi:short-subunit dehydrogenase